MTPQLAKMVDLAFDTLLSAVKSADYATAVKASQIILDRAGFKENKMSIARTWIAKTIEALMTMTDARRVTMYINEKLTVVASRRFKPSKRDRRTEILLTIGQPNYESTQFIKKCKKAGEPFPVKKLQFKYYAKKKL